MQTLFHRTYAPARITTARAAILAVALFAASTISQAAPRDGFLAIQNQVESLQPKLVKTVVNLRSGGATGSGVIVSPDGLIMTAGHVIAGGRSNRVTVTLSDGRTFTAEKLGSDRENDLGLIKIADAKDLPAAQLGDSATLRQGQWVLAMGHPLGEKPGRPPVLRIGRVLRLMGSRDDPEPMVRVSTDAPLISGDSGGPLFDLNGRVIGINSMITSAGRRMASIHVPINLSKAAVEAARKGEAPTSWSGPSSAFTDSLRDAESALRSGEITTAIKAAREASSIDPNSARARFLLARAYAKDGRTEQAAAALVEALDRGLGGAESIRRDPDCSAAARSASVARALERLESFEAIPGQRKGDRTLLSSVTAPTHGRGTIRIRSGEKAVALGVVMSADGDVLTKASELPEGPLEAVLPDGRTVSIKQVEKDSEWDLALLKLSAGGLQTLPISDRSGAGHWTFSPDSTGGLAAVGMVGVAEMPIHTRAISVRPTSKAYLGIRMEPVGRQALEALGVARGVRVLVEPDFPAARAGVQDGDVVFEVDGKSVSDPDSFMDVMVNKKPGDTVSLRVARAEEKVNLTVNLTTRPANIPGRGGLPEMLSGEVSRMQGPFPRVLHHDAILRPDQMGGPVLDSEGRMIGLNIARADRTSTYAIAAKDLLEIYARLKQSK